MIIYSWFRSVFLCEKCDQEFSSKNELENHQKYCDD